MPRPTPYTPDELDTLRRLYPDAPESAILAQLPAHGWSAIASKAGQLGIARNCIWPAADLLVLRQHYAAHGAVYLGRLLGKKPEAVQRKAASEGLQRIYTAVRNERRTARQKAAPKPARSPKTIRRPLPATNPFPAMKISAINPSTLPNLHQQKNKVARSAEAKKFGVIYTSDQIRKMPFDCPVRRAHQFAGDPGVRAYLAQQPR